MATTHAQAAAATVTLSEASISLDGRNSRRTFFVDCGSTALSCGPSYPQELAIAREHAARLGARLSDETAVRS